MFALFLLVLFHLLCTTEVKTLLGIDDFIHICIMFGAYYLGTRLEDAKPIWVGVAIGVSITGCIAMLQWMGWDSTWIVQHAPPSGLFNNRNLLAEAGVVAALIAVYYRSWWALPGVFWASCLPMSRNALGAFALSYLLFQSPWRSAFKGWRMVCLILIAFALVFGIGGGGLDARLAIWQYAIDGMTWHGNGLGSFFETMPADAFAHNEFIQMWFEWGIFSIPIFVMFANALRKEPSLEQSIVACVLLLSMFAFPLHMPFTAFCFSFALGRVFSGRHSVCGAEYPSGAYPILSKHW